MKYELNYQVVWVRNTSRPFGEGRGGAHSFIGGGQNNVLAGGSQVHSFIGGGINNTVSAACSAILGGANNNVTHTFAGVFGNGVNSQAPDTFHVSCLNAVNTPAYVAGGFPVNTLTFWALPAPALGLPAGTKIAVLV